MFHITPPELKSAQQLHSTTQGGAKYFQKCLIVAWTRYELLPFTRVGCSCDVMFILILLHMARILIQLQDELLILTFQNLTLSQGSSCGLSLNYSCENMYWHQLVFNRHCNGGFQLQVTATPVQYIHGFVQLNDGEIYSKWSLQGSRMSCYIVSQVQRFSSDMLQLSPYSSSCKFLITG